MSYEREAKEKEPVHWLVWVWLATPTVLVLSIAFGVAVQLFLKWILGPGSGAGFFGTASGFILGIILAISSGAAIAESEERARKRR